MSRIQIVDDEPNILKSLTRVLRNPDWQIDCFSDPQQALDRLQHTDYAVIISDYQMPQLDGVTYLRFARQRQPDAVRMVLTGQTDREAMVRAVNQAEIHRFLLKPWDEYELVAAVQSALALFQMRRENRELLQQVQRQQQRLNAHRTAWQALAEAHPQLLQLQRDSDGRILLDVDDHAE